MTDEIALHKATAKAARAQELLSDDLLQEAFSGLEASYAFAWRSTMIEDVSAREKLFLAINIVGKVKNHLQAIINDGKLASRELKDLAEMAERKAAWPQIR